MMYHGIHNDQYTIGRVLGRGGEGTVYELKSHSTLVLKVYNEPLTDAKINKLLLMAAMRNSGIETYAAWPIDVVTDQRGNICGFIMKKLTGYMPLHMLFSPMDRKKLFPDKGYNFLVHVARNLATAFHKLHEAGLVVGDVNEGNILINANGLIAFIDCDSFQLKAPGGYFFCEVGVPRYTPPELLKENSFEHIVRTANTDSFSLAVLIFQLLFLGRHPFAGRNKSAADIDEETAIRKREFAYSLDNQKKKLLPPADSFNIADLPEPLVRLFHLAFEHDTRPLPADWIKQLDELLSTIATCTVSRLHTYPGQMQECPWCRFRNTRGILYFIDDSYINASNLLSDIEQFVNGFQVEKLQLDKWKDAPSSSSPAPSPIPAQFRQYKLYNLAAMLVAVILCTALYHSSGIGQRWMLAGIAILPVAIYRFSPWTVKMKAELQQRLDTHTRMQAQLSRMITQYNEPSDAANYSAAITALEKYVHDFRRLPEELERRKKLAEEQVFNDQLGFFLVRFLIEDHAIPSFGAAKKSALYNAGIRNAADMHKLQTTKVPGIGPKNIQLLLDWQRQLSTQFVYIPDEFRMSQAMDQASHQVSQARVRLEQLIRKEYQSISYLKQNIAARHLVLARQVNDLSHRTAQAMVDYDAFQKFSRSVL